MESEAQEYNEELFERVELRGNNLNADTIETLRQSVEREKQRRAVSGQVELPDQHDEDTSQRLTQILS